MPDFLLFILVLGSLLLAHELGHFFIARLTGVRVLEFGIGYPPRLATLFTQGGTKFTLNLLPFGGFNKVAGDDDPSVADGLAAANKRTRAMVLLAGPVANVLMAFLAFTAAFKFAAPDLERVLISTVAQNSPAQTAGMMPGDFVLSVNGQAITGFESLQKLIQDNLGKTTTFVLQRNAEQVTLNLVPRTTPPQGEGPIGVVLGNPTRQTGWIEALQMGWQSTWMQFSEVLHLPGRLIRGEIPPEQARLTGLKGMYDMLAWAGSIDRTSQRPFMTLNFIGLISAGLALANLLPLPALDGGRLLFVLIEALFRRRLAPRQEGLAHAIGFFILLAVVVYIIFQDFIHPIVLPH